MEIDYEPLLLGNPAPEFTANTTQGEVSLSDYKGKWLILFSHPADFTPVCTTEFIAFSGIFDELQKRNTELLGLSIDSLYSHIAWTRNIKEKTGVEIPFPIIDDLSMDIAIKYNMIHPSLGHTSTVRSVFFIDPDGILRAMIYYPMPVGRNMTEIVRIIDALQTSDQFGVATPANWKPGDKVIVPPADTVEKAEANFNNKDYDVTDWYLCKRDIVKK
ncbi:peroxiredoxin [Candidatus Gracilibacteria bacterium]|nr:peroxiredoxin [Candidatus Gracilibacteria bacterium]